MVRRIIVADPDAPTRNLVHLTFGDDGWEVADATTVEALVAAVADGVPDVLVLDVGLPAHGGLAAAAALRRLEVTAGVKILLVTDLASPVPPQALEEAAIDGVLSRPFGTFDLLDAVEGLLAA